MQQVACGPGAFFTSVFEWACNVNFIPGDRVRLRPDGPKMTGQIGAGAAKPRVTNRGPEPNGRGRHYPFAAVAPLPVHETTVPLRQLLRDDRRRAGPEGAARDAGENQGEEGENERVGRKSGTRHRTRARRAG